MIDKETIDIETLITSLNYYVATKQKLDKQKDEYSGYEWGYHFYHEIEECEKAKLDFGITLNEYIDQRIEAKLGGVEK